MVGIRPPDEKWKRMKSVWDACEAAGVDPPHEINEFFNNVPPDGSGVVVDIERKSSAVTKWIRDDASGFEVDLTKLPKDVTVLRFYNSW